MGRSMVRLKRALVLLLGITLLASGCPVTTAQAAFPGENGEIAFSDMPSGAGARADVFTVDSLGALTPVAFTNAGYTRWPAWSPDGTQIAYAQSSDIFVANADGSGKMLVLDWDSTTWDLDWSPDGTMLVAELWACVEDTCTPDIYTMKLDGSGLTNLTGADTYPDRHPAWAPDGSKIAFSSVRDSTPGIFTMNPDGSDVTRITSYAGAPADRFDSNPDWSPDSQKIIFNRGADDSDWPWASRTLSS
jgi:Tol biopolymer transport system component